MRHQRMAAGLVAVAALVAIGCQSGELPTSQNGLKPAFDHAPLGSTVAEVEFFKVCKHGSSADFSSSQGTFSLTDNECTTLLVIGGTGADVSVTETASQPGFKFDSVNVTTINDLVTTTTNQTTNNTVNGHIQGGGGGARVAMGLLVVYFNSGIERGQGCTPGYWKQSQHFDSWTAPYTPTTQFSSVFENAFPGQTLLQVLELGGGGLDALGRHTVAALLNAASGGVSSPFTVAEVVAAFNAVFPGSKAAYTTQKDIFAAANEAGCPLN